MATEIITRTINSTKEKIGYDNLYDIQISLNSDDRLVIRYIPREDAEEKLVVLGRLETTLIIRFIGKLDRLNDDLDKNPF